MVKRLVLCSSRSQENLYNINCVAMNSNYCVCFDSVHFTLFFFLLWSQLSARLSVTPDPVLTDNGVTLVILIHILYFNQRKCRVDIEYIYDRV